jgi:hypothetical protein
LGGHECLAADQRKLHADILIKAQFNGKHSAKGQKAAYSVPFANNCHALAAVREKIEHGIFALVALVARGRKTCSA